MKGGDTVINRSVFLSTRTAGSALAFGILVGYVVATPVAPDPDYILKIAGREPAFNVILLRNLAFALSLALGGAVGGVFLTTVMLVSFGVTVGLALSFAAGVGVPLLAIVLGIVPHGLFELPGFILASSIGVRFGLGEKALAATLLRSTVILILVGAAIEAWISPSLMLLGAGHLSCSVC